ncbi:MAG: ABC transporter ATP-binding protein [Planctomycetota bacterium]
MSVDLELEEEMAQQQLSRRVLGRVMEYVRPHGRKILGCLLLEVVWVATMVAEPKLIQVGIDEKILRADVVGLAWIVAILIGVGIVRTVLDVIELTWNWQAGHAILTDLRKDIFRHVHRLSVRYFDQTKQGRIIARVDRDVDTIEKPLVWGPLVGLSCVVRMAMATTLMLWYDAALCGWVAVWMAPVLLATGIFRRAGMRAHRRVRESMARVTAFLAESIQGIRVIQAFGQERRNLDRFSELVGRYRGDVVKSSYVWNAYQPALRMTQACATAVILILGGKAVLSGQMGVGELSAFVLLLGSFFGPIEWMGDLYNASLSGAAAAERIFLLLDTPPEVVDRPGAEPLPRLRGEVRFDDVWFSYDRSRERAAWTLREASWSAKSGEVIALVGPTGAGKSTIANLLCRFYEPLEGRVLLDGRDVGGATLASLERQIGVVLQEPFLFAGTVLENLRYGRPEATEEEVVSKLEAIGAGWLLAKLSKGVHTELEERGVGLSAGERQLLCVARALLADPAVLVLDEATSALDTRTEATLTAALETLMKGRTTLVIAHRLSTVRRADQILYIDDGRIVERGSHGDLLRLGGRYAELVRAYARDGDGRGALAAATA